MTKPKLPKVAIDTDGSCNPNPGEGGWAAILISTDKPQKRDDREVYGWATGTTNNQMELTAVIEGLRALKSQCEVTISTDSEYIEQAVNQGWLDDWIKRGWKTKGRKPVKNRELWESLMDQMAKHQVKIVWVRGHANHPGNIRADKLANQARVHKLTSKP